MSDARIREMIPSDMLYVMPMLRELVLEMRRAGGPLYPAGIQDPGEDEKFYNHIMVLIHSPMGKGIVFIPQGKVVKGFILSELTPRKVGKPSLVLTGYYFYVDPIFRGHGVGRKMAEAWAEWGFSNGAEAIEVEYQPGTPAEKMWLESGIRPYTATGVWADENWQPKKGVPIKESSRKEV